MRARMPERRQDRGLCDVAQADDREAQRTALIWKVISSPSQ